MAVGDPVVAGVCSNLSALRRRERKISVPHPVSLFFLVQSETPAHKIVTPHSH